MILAWSLPNAPIRSGVVSGIAWAVAPAGGPWLNGYAQIPAEGHPWCTCVDAETLPVECHGGLTYGPRPATPGLDQLTLADTGGWIGFDTFHGFDAPWDRAELAALGVTWPPEWDRLQLPPVDPETPPWTLDALIEETQHLARQIAAASIRHAQPG